jgi:P-type Ca2+ transporter type 2C
VLTGESMPVRKLPGDFGRAGQGARPGGDDLPYVFSGSLIVRGTGIAEVTATGLRSEIGKIGRSLSAIQVEPSRLKSETRRIVRLFAFGGSQLVMRLEATCHPRFAS